VVRAAGGLGERRVARGRGKERARGRGERERERGRRFGERVGLTGGPHQEVAAAVVPPTRVACGGRGGTGWAARGAGEAAPGDLAVR
jgi:hypothetical protein